MKLHLIVTGLVGCWLMTATVEADWPQFRGPSGQSVSQDAKPPIKWGSQENVAWKSPLIGRGPSSPIVVADRVVVTASGGAKQDQLYVLCFDLQSGKELWRRQFWATGRTLCHTTSANAAPTPASDGKRIFAFYSSNDLICLDLDGNLQWFRGLAYDYPTAGIDVGMSSSPVVMDGRVVVQVQNQGHSFAAAIDAVTGKTLWEVDRPPTDSWCSPLVTKTDKRAIALFQGPAGVDACDLKTGKHLWQFEADCSAVPSLWSDGKQMLVASQGLALVDFKEPQDSQWNSAPLGPASSSPVVYDDRIYTLNRAGVLNCGSLSDGKRLWQLRLGGAFWSTPVIADGKIYCFNDAGVAYVVDPVAKKIIAQNEIGERIQGSAVPINQQMVLRTDKALWCFGK